MSTTASTMRMIGVADAAYYAPQIAAEQLGFFADEGIALEYDGGSDRAGLSVAMERGDFDVVLGGLWRPMRRLLDGRPMRVFGQVNEQCDLLLFARQPRELFDWSALEGGIFLHATGGAPSPWFALRHLLRIKGVSLERMRLIPQLPVDESLRMFREGYGELLEIGDLDAGSALLDEGLHQVACWREDIGRLPWSVYYATPELVDARRPQLVALMRALHRAQRWLEGRPTGELAELVQRHFPARPAAEVEAVVGAYRGQRVWSSSPRVDRGAAGRWSAILAAAGWLSRPVEPDELVDDEIAALAVEGVGG
ncbi:ABC transporter substrate-binding protein [Conexibacter sp. CPCC 206217]|uniref:ABC transporter substrate-binding protein n=1 Tax=Conexibacter sp. CPCC 206217 TaxID=3064574 RepID=UPI00271B58E6|nr:ABC transporter substrate-binding protein [Conexibacter sp. CPCC 206217]MDO8210164.1 ABC transporter substrate-binding protein [Conexibacter sp. CPCC 206217]